MAGPDRGIALICDRKGRIQRVPRDDLRLARLRVGALLPAVVAPGSEAKASRMLEAIGERGASFGWELNLESGGEPVTLRFHGAVEGERIVLSGQADEGGLDELTRLNNELINLQRELSRKNRLLEQLNRQKDAFLGMAAHDLRNPIASIRGHAALLLELRLDEEQRRKSLESIVRVAEHMGRLVDDLLDVSTIESGRLELSRQRVAMDELLRRRVEFFELVAEKKSIAVHAELPDEVWAEIDPQRMEQVVDNLVSNAIKYSPPHRSVWVALQSDGDGVRFSVRDEGPGLTDDDRAKIFGMFQRLSARPTAGEKSTGLGLAITKRVVAAHGGTVEVSGGPGRGSTFTVRLPRRAEDAV